MDQLIPVERAAKMLGVHPKTVRHWDEQGSFSGKLYGLRSHGKARELVSAVKGVVSGAGDVPGEDRR
jgi:predicted site-specific integrase-resolvase